MHPATPIQMDIFAQQQAGAPIPAAPAPAPPAYAQYLTGTDQSQFGSLAQAPAAGGAHRAGRPQGENNSITRHSAKKPFVQFTAKSKSQRLQCVTEILPRVLSDRSVPRPDVLVPTRERVKSVCFLFSVKLATEVKRCGCTGMTKDKRSKELKPCDRLHLDLSDPDWTRLGREAYQNFWDFLQHSKVRPYLEPTPEFAAMMST